MLVFAGILICGGESKSTNGTSRQKPRSSSSSNRSSRNSYGSRRRNRESDSSFFGPSFFEQNRNSQRSSYDPHDNHWERSFDWEDKDNDGYDDRDDGFWQEREC